MSTKETKAAIKEIRESLKSENYGDAIHKCQRLLKVDPKNYMAYLLLGAAYQNTDKVAAAKNLRTAIEYSPGTPTVALQGLATCLPTEEQPKIYEQLIAYLPEKYLEYYEKLFSIAKNAAVKEECFKIFKRLATNQNIVEEHAKQALEYLAKLWFINDFAVLAEDCQIYKSAMELLITKSDSDQQFAIYKRYLKWLYIRMDYADCIRNACNMVAFQPKKVYGYEWICKIYCENFQSVECGTWREELREPIEVYAAGLRNLDENSSLAMLIAAFDLYADQQFVAARETLLQVQKLLPNYAVAVELLARTQMHLGAYRLAAPLWAQLGDLHTTEYAQCLSFDVHITHLKTAVEILTALPQDEMNNTALARCFFKLGEMEQLAAMNLSKLAKAEFQMSPKEALEQLDTDADDNSFEFLLLCGKLHVELGNYSKALANVLKATRLKPHFADCFDCLGRIYLKTGDMMRARKCFEKCVNLNALSDQAVTDLSSIYQQKGEEELNEALLLNTLQHLSNEFAVRLQYKLGLHYMEVRKWDSAIHAFRTAIKHDVKCVIYWESLGDAYVSRGSYNSAVRVFQKILEFSPANLYAKLQIALINTTIRMYPEAIAGFDDLLKHMPNYLPALKGAAEAHFGLAKTFKLLNFYGRAKQHLQQSINHLLRVIMKGEANAMVWVWRLTANVLLQTAMLPCSIASLDVEGRLAKRDEAIASLKRRDLLNLAARFFTCALTVRQNTYLWYELSVCCYYSAVYIPEEARKHLETAGKACRMAIKAQSGRWQNWNLLGVINMHASVNNLPLAQHCFIQALNLERKSYTSWTNLGVLYLKLEEIKLSNQAFQRAQQSNPIYPNAWIGQAMIAEAICEEEEAMDLYRHCQQFDYHPESSLGYAHWVCKVLSDANLREQLHYKHAIENMHADTVALDGIDWYVRNEELNATLPALSLQAFLYIRKKLYNLALKPLLQATKLAPPGADRDKLYTNLGYLYLKLKEPEQAINAFNMVGNVTFSPIIGLALAYYHAGQLQESYSVYNSVLNTVDGADDDKAANILVAMAAMIYKFQGDADTKTVLYQCILLKHSPVQALYSAAALGILHHDNQLTETILSELRDYEHSEKYCSDIAYLTAQYYLVNHQAQQAVNYLLARVHYFPTCAALRKVLASFLLENFANDSKYQTLISQMAQSAVVLSHRDVINRSDSAANAEALLLASRALSPIDKLGSNRLIQRAMRLQPQYRLQWLPLIHTAV